MSNKYKYITTLDSEQIPEELRGKTFDDVFPTNDGGEIPVIVEHTTEFNEDGSYEVYERKTE